MAEQTALASQALRFDGRVAIVTGAGTGLGRSHARLLAERGASVVVNDLASAESTESKSVARSVASEIQSAGGIALAHEADVATGEGARSLVDAALDRFGRVDIVVNNAGLLRACDFGDMTEELFDRVVAVSLRGTMLVTHAAWPTLVEQGYGRIISTTSNSGLLGTAGSTAYASAKAGIWGFTRSLALEGAGLGIQVNAIAPIAYTAMSAMSRVAPASWRSGEGDPWARRLDVARVSPAVAWLAHESCGLNGEVWSVAGGRVARFVMGVSQGYDLETLTIEDVRDHESALFEESDLEIFESSAREGKALHRRLMRG
jgi:NAD(P)-dependent dehydrogenase (short-subunit alcohol dehydrogenase family)